MNAKRSRVCLPSTRDQITPAVCFLYHLTFILEIIGMRARDEYIYFFMANHDDSEILRNGMCLERGGCLNHERDGVK